MKSSRLKFPVAVSAGVAVLILIFNVGKQFEWTGFGSDQTTSRTVERNAQRQVVKIVRTTTPQSGKTLWDVLSLVGVPASLALLACWLQVLQQQRSDQQAQQERDRAENLAQQEKERETQRITAEKERAEKLAQQEKEITESNQKEEALQVYIDRISDLLIEKNLIAIATKVKAEKESQTKQEITPQSVGNEPPNVVVTDGQRELLAAAKDVIQARTLSILRRLGDDAERKTAVIQFLAEADVVEKTGLNLSGFDLSGVNLSGANLRGITLTRTNLDKANLSHANLSYAILERANLNNVNLSHVILERANLSFASLSFADFSHANLIKANLYNADLERANLERANLKSAYLTRVNLTNANLSDADLTDANFKDVRLKDAHLKGANLKDTNLKDAKGLTEAQLSKALLCNTELSSEFQSLSNRDCEKLKSMY
jgi:uncharacterized protein YjbI with pentapeptide repeats